MGCDISSCICLVSSLDNSEMFSALFVARQLYFKHWFAFQLRAVGNSHGNVTNSHAWCQLYRTRLPSRHKKGLGVTLSFPVHNFFLPAPNADPGDRPRGRLPHRPRAERGLRVGHTDGLQAHPLRGPHVGGSQLHRAPGHLGHPQRLRG